MGNVPIDSWRFPGNCINVSVVSKIVKQGPSQKVISHHEPTPGNEGVWYEQAQTMDVRPKMKGAKS